MRPNDPRAPDLIAALTALQEEHGHITPEALRALSERERVPLYHLYGLATFYPHFRVAPPPVELLDTPVEFNALARLGSMLGSGAVVAIGPDRCMLDLALNMCRFFRNESCGKCVPCRSGSEKLVGILERFQIGQGRPDDIALIEELAEAMRLTSICGLGQVAPAPFTSALHHFREEIMAHVEGKQCPAGVCPLG